MSLASGGLSVTDLATNTWQRITHMSRYRHLKKIMMAGWIFTSCEHAHEPVTNDH